MMTSLALLFVGAVLLVNGLVFLDMINPRAAVSVNILTGLVLVSAAFHLVLSAPADNTAALDAALGASGFMLFGFTYLTVATNTVMGADGQGLGWYCGWASAVAAFLSAVNFVRIDDPRMALLWLSWAVLFLSFFLALVVPVQWLAHPAGTLAVLQSVTTATVPATLMLTDAWGRTPIAVVGGIQLIVVVVYVQQVISGQRHSTAVAPSV